MYNTGDVVRDTLPRMGGFSAGVYRPQRALILEEVLFSVLSLDDWLRGAPPRLEVMHIYSHTSSEVCMCHYTGACIVCMHTGQLVL